ncbi:hypothetical protein NBT05_09785 [Aquimarina sp. ERC-38]|uniref:hypothetical protein n=1 Tax=Aquimarina sp. ERC-38 TaxID=2949996 RepID=UPI00224856F3|nr:hypothetical protein [Aquimarina sp. ERC-38]UZO79261.1 hypothetical protein NBT05_09785 [Aquimarina sp. ERC-38]
MEQIIHIKSPKTGKELWQVSANLFTDGEVEYPYIDRILYIRDQPKYRDQAVALLKEDKITEATALLLRDQDAFSKQTAPDVKTICGFLKETPTSLADAMQFLNYGPVADYFNARWSSPTFVSGLALMQHILDKNKKHVEVACGIGQFLKIAENNQVQTVGMDVVFSKLWLGRNYLGLKGILICTDINENYEITIDQPVSALCQDALYFLEHKNQVLQKIRSFSQYTTVAVGHCHTDKELEYPNGFPLSYEQYKALITRESIWITDQTLIKAWLQDLKIEESNHPEVLQNAKALSWIEGRINETIFPLTPPEALRVNPLLSSSDFKVEWPSESYKKEYVKDYAYLLDTASKLDTAVDLFQDKQHYYKNRILIETTV